MSKLIGFLNMMKGFKGANHYSVPMTSALWLPKGEKANVHSGFLTICSFGVVKIISKKDKSYLGHLFVHQGNMPLQLKTAWNKDWVGELLHVHTAPDTKYGSDEWSDVDLGKELASVGVEWDASKMKDGESQSWMVTTSTFDVDGETVTPTKSSTSAFAQPKKPGNCVLL